MRKLVSILLICLSATTTEIPELLKFPFLYHHYIAHKADGSSNDFIGFLNEHYIRHEGDDNDKREDQQLPFQAIHVEHLTSIYLINRTPEVDHPVFVEITVAPAANTSFKKADDLREIFHPPRSIV